MPGIFTGLNTAVRGMQTSQVGINTTNHNITNANTEGYSRQRVELETSKPFDIKGLGQLGSGVNVDRITRVRDTFLDSEIRYEEAISGEFNTRKEALEQVEIVFMEPSENGLNEVMSKMWNSWQELSNHPESSTARTIVTQNSVAFTTSVNHMHTQLENIKENLNNVKAEKLQFVKSITGQVDSLNSQIVAIKQSGAEPNDLMDKRDLLINELSEFFQVKTTPELDGTVKIQAVLENGTYDLDSSTVGNFDTVLSDLKHGSLKGHEDMITEIENYQEKLDTLAKEIGDAINEVHSENGTKQDFFIYTDGSEGKTIQVNPLIVDGTVDINAGDENLSGDGSTALEIGQLRNKHTIGNKTFDSFYKDTIAEIGIVSQDAVRMSDNQETLLRQLNERKESISGVSIDEEIANLVQFQKTYEANSKVISTLVEMLDVIINRMGL